MTYHIHAPPPVEAFVRWHDCPDCTKRSPFVRFCYEWYEGNSTCMRCGREYNADGWVRAPLMRRWREESKARARKYYKDVMAYLRKATA